MIAVTSPGFVLFAALLAGLWYACPPPRRWQLMLGANLVFYAVLCWQALPVLLDCTFLVWWCGRRTAAKGTFYAGLAAALFRCCCSNICLRPSGGRASWPMRWASATLRCSL